VNQVNRSVNCVDFAIVEPQEWDPFWSKEVTTLKIGGMSNGKRKVPR